MSSYRIDGMFRLRSPLSHIGETISATSYLVQEKILQDDGRLEEVFSYSGNAWRGQLRDLIASYMLDHLGSPKLGVGAFHLLFSGGRIGGPQSVDIEQGRRMRAAVPMIALLGGGVGNQILEGKLRVGNSYPLCEEAIPVLPKRLHDRAAKVPYANCTMEKQHSRRDDAKIESVRRHLETPEDVLLLGPAKTEKKTKKTKEDDGPADQMRIGMELVCPGVTLYTWMTLRDVTQVEIGALVSGLHAFSSSPMIGGKGAIGYGLVDLDYEITDTETGEAQHFVSVADGVPLLGKPAVAAKEAYDQHLRSMYDQMLTAGQDHIVKLLGAA